MDGRWRRGRPRMRREDRVRRDLKRMGGEWRTTATNKSWIVLIQNVLRAKSGKKRRKKEKDDGNLGQSHPRRLYNIMPRGEQVCTVAKLTPDDRDAKRRTSVYCGQTHPRRHGCQ